MTIEEAKKAGYKHWIGDEYSVWMDGVHCLKLLVTVIDPTRHFPTRAKMREARRKRKMEAEHDKWLADMQSQMTPITSEQEKMLRDNDTVYHPSPIENPTRVLPWLWAKDDALSKECLKRETLYFTRAAAQAALDKAKACDMPDILKISGKSYRRLKDGELHDSDKGDLPVDGSQTHRFGSVWYRPVESHEQAKGETQPKEVVTDETQKPTTVRGWLETIPDARIREAALGYCSSTDAAKECTALYAAIDIVTSPRWTEEGSKFWHERMDADYYRKPWPAYPEKAKREADSVSHPSHYTSHPSGVECITITKHMSFCRGNAVKYLWRAGQKGDSLDKEIEDIAKAEEYCRIEKERLIATKGAK